MSGYIGTQPVPQATQTRDSFTATSGQTSFATGGYTPNFLDVYLNGVKLASADYTASNGSDVVLASGAATGDILEVVAFTTFNSASSSIDDNGNATAITIDSNENVMVGKAVTNLGTAGITLGESGFGSFTRSGYEPLNVNRLSSDGAIAKFYKDGTEVGSIGTLVSYLNIGTGDTGLLFQDSNDFIGPWNASSNAGRDAAIDLGTGSGGRFKDLYLSGGVYLGGTGSANKLEDYEEGTWTAGFSGTTATSISNTTGYYTKIGNTVHFTYYSSQVNLANAVAGGARITGLPFTSSNSSQRYGLFLTSYGNAVQGESNGGYVAKNDTYMNFMLQESNAETTWYNGTGKRIMVAGTYMVD